MVAAAIGVLLVAGCSSSGSNAGEPTARTSCAVVSDIAAPTASLPKTTAAGEVTVHGDALTAIPENGKTDPEKGCPVPIVDGQDFDGTPVRIGGPTDKPTVVIAAAHWCPHCNNELPKVEAFVEKGGVADSVSWIVLSTGINDDSPNYPPGPWLRRTMGWAGEAMADDADSRAGHALGVAGFPSYVLIDAQGQVVERFSGETEPDVLATKIDALIAASAAAAASTTGGPPGAPTTSAAAQP